MHAPVTVVLKPLSHPEASEIRIRKECAIGRAAQPFASYGREMVMDLSRQHARIVCANDAVYLADLGSKNGTTVNRVSVGTQPHALHDGDEVCFGGVLSYRVELAAPPQSSPHASRIVGVTLAPEHDGLQPIHIRRFPFLIGKTTEEFARYKQDTPEQLHYLSRRHACVLLKEGLPVVADLGSTNGTYADGRRLGEEPEPLEDGARLAFGGDHFAYRVRLEHAAPAAPKAKPAAPTLPVAEPVHLDRTTFVAAPASFLELFCAEPAEQQRDDSADATSAASGDTGTETAGARSRSRFAVLRSRLAVLLCELRSAAGATEGDIRGRTLWSVVAGTLVLALIILSVYLWGASERDLKGLVANGSYAKAATLADTLLPRDPDNAELKALATEAGLKAHVPTWVDRLKAQDFVGARAVFAQMKALGRHNADLSALLDAMAWIGDLEQFVASRGGADAPIRVYTDEEHLQALLKRWNDNPQGLQRALGRVAAHVAEFKHQYADSLTQLRKLQSDARVHLAAIDRLKAAIGADLKRDTPEALHTLLQEYAEKYPRLGGLDAIREDLRQYLELDAQARAQNLRRLVSLTAKVEFATPPFREKYAALKASDRFPPVAVVEQYEAVSRAWRAGDTRAAFSGLQRMAGQSPQAITGPWAEAAARELARKRTIAEQFFALQRTRGSNGFDERLLAFHETLDPDEDAHFTRAIAADVQMHKDKAIARAQVLQSRAQSLWHRYRESGAIEGRQRLEATLSDRFRTQAALLSEAYELTRKATQIYQQLHMPHPPQWDKVRDEIKTEAQLQRKSLLELRNVLEPWLLKAKLALLGGRIDDARK
jgi:pSer/pThr/pTyr-binding forkhead associated (FHA) protein